MKRKFKFEEKNTGVVADGSSLKIAAAYLRVSTERQDEYSLDSQLELIRSYAYRNSYIVPDEFVYVDDGISGRSAEKRPAFLRMISAADDKDCPFEVILVWKYSRFARNQEESILYKALLSRSGVDVVSVSEPLVEGPFGGLIERVLEWDDEFYSIRLSGEVQRGMLKKSERGEAMTLPAFGYDIVNKIYVPNKNADIVRKIYAEYLSGKGAQTIARELGESGVRTRRGNRPDNRFVDYILSNPIYIGKMRWSLDGKVNYCRGGDPTNGIVVDGKHEPIIDEDTWNAVQEKKARLAKGRRKYERRDQPVEWMLKGLVRCSNCGSTLVYAALACPSMQCHQYAKGVCTISHSLSINKANKIVIEALEQAAVLGVFPIDPNTKPAPSDGPDYTKLINQEKSKLKRVQEAYEAGIDTLQEYAEKKKKINSAIASLEKKMAEVETTPAINIEDFRRKVLDVVKILKDETVLQNLKNEALKSIVSYIVYEKADSRLAIYFYT